MSSLIGRPSEEPLGYQSPFRSSKTLETTTGLGKPLAR